METNINIIHSDMIKIQKDLELIKNVLFSEGELSKWARKELANSRKAPSSEYLSHEEVKKRIFAK